MDTISQIKNNINPQLEIEGLLRTMFDNRANLSREVSDELKKGGFNIYKTIIPRNIKLAEAPSFGKPALHYDKSSLGARAYLALAGEILKNEKMKKDI
jgi:chromosome partitioning protein